MSAIINPVKSVLKECENKNTLCGIHTMSDMCYGICNDYQNTPECLETCRKFIENKRACAKGPNKVGAKASPNFNYVNDNFTPYVEQLGVEEALKKCNSVCDDRSQNPHECKQKCRLNANAIIKDKDNDIEDYKHQPTEPKKKRSKFLSILIFLGVVCVVGLVMVIVYYFVTKQQLTPNVNMGFGLKTLTKAIPSSWKKNMSNKALVTVVKVLATKLNTIAGRDGLVKTMQSAGTGFAPTNEQLKLAAKSFCDTLDIQL